MVRAASCAIALALPSLPLFADPAPRPLALVSIVRYHYECVTEKSDPSVRLAWTFATSGENEIRGTYWNVRLPRGELVHVTSVQALGDGEPPASPGYDPTRCRVTARDSRPVVAGAGAGEVGRIDGLAGVAFIRAAPGAGNAMRVAARFPSPGERVRVLGADRDLEARVDYRFPDEGYFVLDRALESACTGAPVVDRSGRVLGLVTHPDKPAAYVRRIDAASLGKAIRWGTATEALRP